VKKEGYIIYWVEEAARDWDRAIRSFKDNDFIYCLFFLHLALEKICKALWVKFNESNHPPRIHNLVTLIKQAMIELEEDMIIFLGKMNRFQLETRYPGYIDSIYKFCTKEYTKEMLEKGEKVKLCLIKELQKK
jgi:HEPN domain-containing protein